MMTVEIHDYKGRARAVLFDIERVDVALMETISGDEVLTLIYQDGTVESFDSSDSRVCDSHDGLEVVYQRAPGINKLKEGGAS